MKNLYVMSAVFRSVFPLTSFLYVDENIQTFGVLPRIPQLNISRYR